MTQEEHDNLKFFCEINFAVISFTEKGKGRTPFYKNKMTKRFKEYLREYDPNLEKEAIRREKK